MKSFLNSDKYSSIFDAKFFVVCIMISIHLVCKYLEDISSNHNDVIEMYLLKARLFIQLMLLHQTF